MVLPFSKWRFQLFSVARYTRCFQQCRKPADFTLVGYLTIVILSVSEGIFYVDIFLHIRSRQLEWLIHEMNFIYTVGLIFSTFGLFASLFLNIFKKFFYPTVEWDHYYLWEFIPLYENKIDQDIRVEWTTCKRNNNSLNFNWGNHYNYVRSMKEKEDRDKYNKKLSNRPNTH